MRGELKRTLPISTLVALAMIAAAPDARSDAGDLQLAWEAPPGCPSAGEVHARVARLRASGGSTAAPRPVEVRARVSGAGEAWRLDLSLITEQAATDRVLEGSSCAELADATALLVVLASDADAGPPAAGEAGSRERDRSTPPFPEPTPPGAPRTAPRPVAPGVRLALRLFGAGDVASLPAPSLGGGAAAALDVGPVRAEVVGTWLPGREARVGDGDAGAEVSLVAVTPRGCWVPHRGTVEVAGCLGLELGSLRAEAFGVSDPGVGSALWLAPHVGVLGGLELAPPVRVVVGVEAAVPLARERFVLGGVGDVHEPPPVTARATVGLELRP